MSYIVWLHASGVASTKPVQQVIIRTPAVSSFCVYLWQAHPAGRLVLRQWPSRYRFCICKKCICMGWCMFVCTFYSLWPHFSAGYLPSRLGVLIPSIVCESWRSMAGWLLLRWMLRITYRKAVSEWLTRSSVDPVVMGLISLVLYVYNVCGYMRSIPWRWHVLVVNVWFMVRFMLRITYWRAAVSQG